jgi:DNA gyrase inhibitor GyrI
MITDREKFLMIQWGKANQNYETVEDWLSVVMDDFGHTVEQELSYDADQHQLNLTEQD